MPGSRVGLWIVESFATPGLYCVVTALARNLNYYDLIVSL